MYCGEYLPVDLLFLVQERDLRIFKMVELH